MENSTKKRGIFKVARKYDCYIFDNLKKGEADGREKITETERATAGVQEGSEEGFVAGAQKRNRQGSS